jgi:hypothetical protein
MSHMPFESFNGQLASLIATFLWSLGMGLISYYLVYKTALFNHLIEVPLVPPFLALPAVMFAFLMGFMSSDAWQNYSYARTALINESVAIKRILNIPVGTPELQNNIKRSVQRYLEGVLNEEWADSINKSPSSKAQASIDDIELSIWQGVAACSQASGKSLSCVDSAMSSAVIGALNDLRSARRQRLSLGYVGSTDGKWIFAILLGLISVASVAAAHRHNIKTGITAIILYCLSVWIILSIAVLFSNPYKGSERLKPIPFMTTLESLKNTSK